MPKEKNASGANEPSKWRSKIVGHEKVQAGQLMANPFNHRRHPEKQRKVVAASIEELGFIKSVLVNKVTGHIVDGHERVMQALGVGEETLVDVEYVELSPEDEKKALLVLDASSELAEVDASSLNQLVKECAFDMGVLDDLAKEMLADFPMVDDEPKITEDDIPEPPVDPITKLGDLWILGEHRVLCGDSTKAEDVARLMGGKRADMVFTDPPYNCADEMSESFYANANSPAMKGLAAAKWDKGFSPDEFLNRVEEIRPDNGTVYVCTSHMLAPEIWSYMEKSKATHSSYLVWCKPNPMPSLAKRHPTWATELICYATFGKHVFNFPEEGHSLSWWSINKNAKNDLHPTQKPVAVPAKAIELSSKPGQVIADLFLGSGTTLIAAEQLGRKCYGMEISPQYCDVIVKRWENLTGKKAVLETVKS